MPEIPPQGPPLPDNEPKKEINEAEHARLLERAERLFESMARDWAALLAAMKLAPDRRTPEPKSRQEVEFGEKLFRYLHDEYDPRLDVYVHLINNAVILHVWNFDPPPGSIRSLAQRGANQPMQELTEMARVLGAKAGPLLRANMMDLRTAVLARDYFAHKTGAAGILENKFLKSLVALAETLEVDTPEKLVAWAKREGWLEEELPEDLEGERRESLEIFVENIKTSAPADEPTEEKMAEVAREEQELKEELATFFEDPDFRDHPGALANLVLGSPPELAY